MSSKTGKEPEKMQNEEAGGVATDASKIVVEWDDFFERLTRVLDRIAPPKPPLKPVGEISSERRQAAEEMRSKLQAAFTLLEDEDLKNLAEEAGIEVSQRVNLSMLAEQLAHRPGPPRG